MVSKVIGRNRQTCTLTHWVNMEALFTYENNLKYLSPATLRFSILRN